MSAKPFKSPNDNFYPVLLAGGSGTRFWPRSRRARAKQVLPLDGEQSMIQQTMERLLPLAPRENFWVITNSHLEEILGQQLGKMPPVQMLCEPVARNTAPAAGLVAFLLEREAPEAVLGMFPADHVVTDEERFLETLAHGIKLAAEDGNIIVLGVRPTRPEVGYGYIETGTHVEDEVLRVRRFTEKPNQTRAEEFVAAGNFLWNSGIFLWKAKTLADAMREHLSETAPYLEQIAAAYGTPELEATFAELYPKCENISLDYAVLEPRSTKGERHSNIFCLPADFGWNDLGSWAALYEHQRGTATGSNVLQSADSYVLRAEGNYVYAPDHFIALVGVDDLVVVDTGDALLITTRQQSQDVGKVVRHLKQIRREELL
jgi:mannose-1-phosphate guanylyltransferase